MTTDAWLNQLQENGFRLTGARRAVVETVHNSTRALTPVEVFDMARKRYRALGLVSVYRTLEKLEELQPHPSACTSRRDARRSLPRVTP